MSFDFPLLFHHCFFLLLSPQTGLLNSATPQINVHFLRMDDSYIYLTHIINTRAFYFRQTHHSPFLSHFPDNIIFPHYKVLIVRKEDLILRKHPEKHLKKKKMASSKAAFCMVALLVCSIFVGGANCNEISYGALTHGNTPHCTRLANKGCLPPPSNTYNRGCEKEENCRGGSRKLK